MYKSFLTSDIRSGWERGRGGSRRVPQNRNTICLIEHEVTIGGGSSGIEVVARFIHALPEEPRQGFVRNWRGGLVGLTLRRTRNSTNKRIGCNRPPKCTFRLRAIAITPQTPSTMGGSPSPVTGPIPVSVTSSGMIPALVSANPETTKESMSPAPSVPSPVAILPEQSCAEIHTTGMTGFPSSLSPDADSSQTSSWLRAGRFHTFESTFASFSASDILRLSRDDLIQICGLADGIRLFNALHSKAPAPRLTLYFSTEGTNGVVNNPGNLWRAVYLDNLTSNSLANKLHNAIGALGSSQERLHSVLIQGPQGIHVLVTDDLVANMKDESMYIIETIKDSNSERYKILLKPSSR